MQVSDIEIQKILTHRVEIIAEIDSIMDGINEPEFAITDELVQAVTKRVIEMPDRQDRIDELKSKIDSGQYNPTSAEIVDSMIRRTIADSVR